MFCRKCGQTMEDGVAFCMGCGTRATVETAPTPSPAPRVETADLSRPLFVLRPQFEWGLGFASVWPAVLVGTILVALFFPCIGPLLALPFALIAWPVLATLQRNTYERTVYRVFPDRIEYQEGYFAHEYKTLSFRNVMEVHLSNGMVEQKYNLGSVLLTTSGGSVSIRNIPRSNLVYQKLKQLVDQAQGEGQGAYR